MSQREEAREGGDLQLTCVANKYLYTALSWQRVNGSPVLSGQQLTSGEFSNSQVLLLSNLTARDSGAYRCSVRHLITGQETHLDTQVLVTSEWSQLYDLPILELIFFFTFKRIILLCYMDFINSNQVLFSFISSIFEIFFFSLLCAHNVFFF